MVLFLFLIIINVRRSNHVKAKDISKIKIYKRPITTRKEKPLKTSNATHFKRWRNCWMIWYSRAKIYAKIYQKCKKAKTLQSMIQIFDGVSNLFCGHVKTSLGYKYCCKHESKSQRLQVSLFQNPSLLWQKSIQYKSSSPMQQNCKTCCCQRECFGQKKFSDLEDKDTSAASSTCNTSNETAE